MRFDPLQHDLATPDGTIVEIVHIDERTAMAQVLIEEINRNFVGFEIDHQHVFFNIKSTLAQLGVNGLG
ncbi:MAG TPA: hypothetical protein VN457_03720, partial [Chlamydiales bacterium]|nr:hypothetical protein [Chlamydiales bacterium]